MQGLTPLILIGGLGLLFHFLPNRTRPALYFAVTVDPAFRNSLEGRKILLRFRTRVWLITVTLLALAGYLLSSGLLDPRAVALGIILPHCILLNLAVVLARKQTLLFQVRPAGVRQASLSPSRLRLPGGPIVAAGPFVVLTAISVYVALRWEALPARFPSHFGPAGPDAWMDRTPANVVGFLIMLVALCLLYLALQYGVVHHMRRIHAEGAAAESEHRFKRATLILLQVNSYLVAIPAAIAFLTRSSDDPLLRLLPWMFGGFIVFTVICVGMMIRWGQGGGLAAQESDLESAQWGDGTPDDCWKWGLFYFNPADDAVMVETRFGIGQTLNMGRTQSWVLMGLLLVPIAIIAYLQN